MGISLKGRNFITLKDYSPEEITYLLDLAAQKKKDKKNGKLGNSLKGKNIALIFEKPSTRTRCAFVVGARDEGGQPEYLGKDDIQLGHKESVEDTARVLGRMFDGIEFRGFKQKTVEDLAKYSGVPVWNGLTDEYHPTQILADLLTMREHFGHLKGLKFVFAGDGRNNMANSLMIGMTKMGVHFTIFAPKELWPEQRLVDLCRGYAEQYGSSVTILRPEGALAGAAPGGSLQRLRGAVRILRHDLRPDRMRRRGGCHLHGRLGFHGRGGEDRGARKAAASLPGERGTHEEDGKGHHDLPALPPGGEGKRGHGGSVRVSGFSGI